VLLHKIVNVCIRKHIIFGISRYSNREKTIPEPSIKIAVPIDLSHDEIKRAIAILEQATDQILSEK